MAAIKGAQSLFHLVLKRSRIRPKKERDDDAECERLFSAYAEVDAVDDAEVVFDMVIFLYGRDWSLL